MRTVIQRVSEAKVSIEGMEDQSIRAGYLVLLGIEEGDGEEDISYLLKKITQMRIFPDEEGKMNHSLIDTDGELLIVSQFTLHASTKKGNRPSFIKAARPELAERIYLHFVEEAKNLLPNKVKTGQFGASMKIQLCNVGPTTIIMDSKNKE